MNEQPQPIEEALCFSTRLALLPGPDRKRGTALYRYRVTYRDPDRAAAGCVMLWEVSGGRAVYQAALEREETGNLRLHCTCADAVFRAEDEGRFCKHIHGLLRFGRPAQPSSASGPADRFTGRPPQSA